MHDILGRVVQKLVQLPAELLGTVYDLLEKISGPKASMWRRRLKRFLRGENSFGVPKTFEVTTDGRSGEQFIIDLEEQGDHISGYAKGLLRSKEFVVTKGLPYRLALILGDKFKDDERTTDKIRAYAVERGYLDPPVEVAPLVREMFSDEDLEQIGLRALIIMHKPVSGLGGGPRLLGVIRDGGGRRLSAFDGEPGVSWSHGFGFVFLVPQVAS